MGATCDACGGDMTAVDLCTNNREVLYPDGVRMPTLPYKPAPQHMPHNGRCHDCGVAVGARHHPGCDMERCPRCHGQLISCDCLDVSYGDWLLVVMRYNELLTAVRGLRDDANAGTFEAAELPERLTNLIDAEDPLP